MTNPDESQKTPEPTKDTPEQSSAPQEAPESPDQEDKETSLQATAQETTQGNEEKDQPPAENENKKEEVGPEETPKPPPSNDIYFVGTPDTKITNLCREFLKKQGFKLINILDRKYSQRTLEQRCKSFPRVSFAVVILSGENFVYSKNKKPADARLRAPQDLVFAMGFFMGKLGRQNVFVLYQEQKSFILPTLYHHAIYTPLDSKELWKDELILRLKNYQASQE